MGWEELKTESATQRNLLPLYLWPWKFHYGLIITHTHTRAAEETCMRSQPSNVSWAETWQKKQRERDERVSDSRRKRSVPHAVVIVTSHANQESKLWLPFIDKKRLSPSFIFHLSLPVFHPYVLFLICSFILSHFHSFTPSFLFLF